MASTVKTKLKEKEVSTTGAKLFDAIVLAFREGEPGVERVKLFGYDCLRAAGKVFAKTDKGRLVMKLPKPRIEALIMAGQMAPYEGKRGEMKEWVVVDSVGEQLAITLADEARKYAGG